MTRKPGIPQDVGRAIAVSGLLLCSGGTSAESILDRIRGYDLNDYALGLSTTLSQSPYTNADSSFIAYPVITGFTYPSFDDAWLLLSDAELGVRRVLDNGWEFGAVGRVETLSLGSDRPPELQGLNDRRWSVELAPFAGYRGWPIDFRVKSFREISGRYGGWTHELQLLYPKQRHWGYIVPSLTVSYRDDGYTGYYFGVSDVESRSGRPAYDPGGTTNVSAQLRVGHRLTESWLMITRLTYEALGSAITDSPIVDAGGLWSGGVSFAYNADIYQPRDFDPGAPARPRFRIRAGLFRDHITTTLRINDENGIPGDDIHLEDLLDIPDLGTVAQFDAIWRIGHFHRLEMGYFDFSRSESRTPESEFSIGADIFAAGQAVEVTSGLRVTRLSYSYSLIHDAQKELAVTGGIHESRLKTQIVDPDSGRKQRVNASTPLPVIGIDASVNLRQRTRLSARLQLFRMEFDQYEGGMSLINVMLEHDLPQHVSIGFGYSYYRLKLESDGEELNGRAMTEHHGPFVFASLGF